jgi:hypothetical protein
MMMHGLANPKFNDISSTAGVYKAAKDLEKTLLTLGAKVKVADLGGRTF